MFVSILQLQICLELKLPLFDHNANFTMDKKIIIDFVKQSKDLSLLLDVYLNSHCNLTCY